jgi:Sec-independent protein translocase protein TatA
MSVAAWLVVAAIVLVVLLALGFRVAIRSLRRFVRAFWPHS